MVRIGSKIGGRDQQALVRRDTIAGGHVYGVTAVSAKWQVLRWGVSKIGKVVKAWRKLLEGRKQPL
jgi:hypothetical protein